MSKCLKPLFILSSVVLSICILTAAVCAVETPLDLIFVLDTSNAMLGDCDEYGLNYDKDSYSYDDVSNGEYYYNYDGEYYKVNAYKYSSKYFLRFAFSTKNIYLWGSEYYETRDVNNRAVLSTDDAIYYGQLFIKGKLPAVKYALCESIETVYADANTDSTGHRVGIYTNDTKIHALYGYLGSITGNDIYSSKTMKNALLDTAKSLTISGGTCDEPSLSNPKSLISASGDGNRKALVLFNSGATDYSDAIADVVTDGIDVYLVTTDWNGTYSYGKCDSEGECSSLTSADSLKDAFLGAVNLALTTSVETVSFNVAYGDGTPTACTCNVGEKYDITQNVTAGYLYGGTYTDNTYSAECAYEFAEGENGKSFTPTEGTTYYVREVPQEYLWPLSVLISSTDESTSGELIDMILVSAVDDSTQYTKVGFAVKTGNTNGKYLRYEMTDVYGKLQVRFSDTNVTNEYTSKNVNSKLDDGSPIFVCCLRNGESDTLTGAAYRFFPYYVTLDGVTVQGSVYRKVEYDSAAETKLVKNKLYYTNTIVWGEWDTQAGEINLFASAYAETKSVRKGLTFHDTFSMSVNESKSDIEFTVTKVYDGFTETQSFEKSDIRGTVKFADKDGYIFCGWFVDAGLTKPADFSAVDGDMTVYAKYIPSSFVEISGGKKLHITSKVNLGTLTVKIGDEIKYVTPVSTVENVKKEQYWEICRSILAKVIKTEEKYSYTVSADAEVLSVSFTTADGTNVIIY